MLICIHHINIEYRTLDSIPPHVHINLVNIIYQQGLRNLYIIVMIVLMIKEFNNSILELPSKIGDSSIIFELCGKIDSTIIRRASFFEIMLKGYDETLIVTARNPTLT